MMMVALKSKFGIITANINFARGLGRLTPLAYRGIGEHTEKEILTVVVPEAQADEIFTFIYHEAHINRPHGGLMYMYPLQQCIPFSLPHLQEEGST
jgi:nitrogen regulatory protein PII